MVRTSLALGLLSVLGLAVLPASGLAQPPAAQKEARERKEALERFNHVILAHHLIELGHDEDTTPESRASALLLAAELLAKANPMPGELKSDKGSTQPGTVPDLEALVEEARKLGKSSPALLARADAVGKLVRERSKDPTSRPTSFSGELKGQGIYEHAFIQGRPASVFVYCPGGQTVTVKVMNTDTVPPTTVAQQTGSNFRLEWIPTGTNRLVAHKIFIVPQSPVPFFITWATN